MKLTIIGHWGGYPAKNEASSGYLIQNKGFNLLIDCGSGVLSALQNILLPEELDAVVISHYHPDHVADIGVLQHALLIGKHSGKHNKTLPIYGHMESANGFRSLSYKDITKGHAYFEQQPFNIGPFTINTLRTNHPVPCFAMRIQTGQQSLVFTADSAFQDSFVSFSESTDLLLCEANFFKGMNGKAAGHMTSEEAGVLAQKANVKKLVLTHLPHFGNISQLQLEAEQYFSGPVVLARQNLTLTI
ncbi:MBL fold metallo-hydrolase [Bacillus spongiae]|uniref:MBL fold metallo-hydrolase n=1 Tax=Bacillus spongiae TaxID=2683610 RepID=A0ABU8HAY2_9BACI